MKIDFHTHGAAPDGMALRSVGVTAAGSCRYTSLELHPWHLPETTGSLSPEFLAAAERADAIGECGLDRLRGPLLPVQAAWLDEVLFLAETLRKPVVIHCVRAVPELLAAFRKHPGVRRLFHGFRGSPELLKELLEHGFTVSLHRSAIDRPGIAPLLLARKLADLPAAAPVPAVLPRRSRPGAAAQNRKPQLSGRGMLHVEFILMMEKKREIR